MKTLVLMSVFVSSLAFAAPKKSDANVDICQRFMICGTYIAPRDQNIPDDVETKIVISSTGDLKAQFDYTLTNKDGDSSVWPLEVTFQEDGSAVMKYKGTELYAVAICKYNICDFSLIPFESKNGGFRGNSGMLRFTGTSLEMLMTWGLPVAGGSSSETKILQKQ